MRVRFLDLHSQYLSIKEEIDASIKKIIDNNSYALGPAVNKFEADFAKYCGSDYCIGVDSGTNSLFLILKAMEIGAGDEVIIPANTFIATAAAVIHAGAKPVPVDMDPVSRNIDLHLVDRAVTSATKAIMPVHLYGAMVDMPTLIEFAESKKLIVIEDAAQAQGAKFNNRPAGSFGLASGFSFYPGKNLGAYGEAGAIVTSDKRLDRKLRMLRDHGSEKKYYHDIIGYNARMHGMQGAVLGVKLQHLDDWNIARNNIADGYRDRLKPLDIKMPAKSDLRFDVYHQFVIEVDKREKMQEFLRDNGIDTMIHYPIPIHKQKAFIDLYGSNYSFPVTEKLADRILSLPIYPEMTDEMVDFVSEKIIEFYN